MKRTVLTVLMAVVVMGLAGGAGAVVALYDAGPTDPAPNPNTQGWDSVAGQPAGVGGYGLPVPAPAWGLNAHTGHSETFDQTGLFAANPSLLGAGFVAKATIGFGGVTTGTNPLLQAHMLINTGSQNFTLYIHQDGADDGSGNGGLYYDGGAGAVLIEGRVYGDPPYDEGTFHDYEVRYDAGAGEVTVLEDNAPLGTIPAGNFGASASDLFGVHGPNHGGGVGETRISVRSASLEVIPEPATLCLLGLGGLALLRRRR